MGKPLELPSPADAARMLGFFEESGYSFDNLLKILGTDDIPSKALWNIPQMLDRTQAPTTINLLIRLFWIGSLVEESTAHDVLPEWFTGCGLGCNLLRKEGKQFVSEVMVLRIQNLLLVSDRPSRLESSEPDVVSWPSPSSRCLANFTMRHPSRATLDIGTGNGVQALLASSHSERVVATDLNERALNMAAFNARLNGIENVEFVFGDGFVPVKGPKFDMVISNPPFFIAPSDKLLFCDNPLELDQLCRAWAREAANHLNEGGYFQMICEWSEVHGQPWKARLAEWFVGTGCDAWVLKIDTRSPLRYTHDHAREMALARPPSATVYREHMEYYRDRHVEAIHGGVVAMRRRSGPNWLVVEECKGAPRVAFGDFVLARFAAQDFLRSHTASNEMLAAKFLLSPGAHLEESFEQQPGEWKSVSLTLKFAPGFPFSLPVQPLVSQFLIGCDGTRTLGELAQELATKATVPHEQVEKECIEIVRRFVARGYLRPA